MLSAELENEFEFDFKAIVDAANDIVIVTRADLIEPPGPVIVYVNQAFCELTGYSRDEVIGKNPRILQASGTDPTTKTRIKRALRKQQPVRTTIRNYAKSGRAYWLDLSILPLCNTSGQVTHFVAIERDVTEQSRARTDPADAFHHRSPDRSAQPARLRGTSAEGVLALRKTGGTVRPPDAGH